MADVGACVQGVLRQEDAGVTGEITNTRGDVGGKTRYGIASRFHPQLLAGTYYTTMCNADALKIALNLLETEYAAACGISFISDQNVAHLLLSFAVNASVRRAVGAMQSAVNLLHPGAAQLALDGRMGPKTLAAINGCYAVSLANSFRLRMVAYYVSLCRYDKGQREFLIGWLDRALN